MTHPHTDPFLQPLPYTFRIEDDSQLDPSLVALAAQVQAVAHANAQGIDIDINIDPSIAELAAVASSGAGIVPQDVQIDPALFEIAEVVEDVNRGRIRLDDPSTLGGFAAPAEVLSSHNAVGVDHLAQAVGGEAEAITFDDPTLREIVNSLNNAQQSSHVVGPGLSHAQAAAAIGAHLTDAEERERLHQSLQTTLEDLTQASLGSLFPTHFGQSPGHNYLSLHADTLANHNQPHDYTQPGPSSQHLAGPSSQSLHDALSHQDDTPAAETGHESSSQDSATSNTPIPPPVKRGRGRPKGSKNKVKAKPKPRPPKPPVATVSRPKGRPPKVRTPEDQADYDLRKQEKALGIKRQKGRPRKFPGYLVREMRLRKNREEFNELLRSHEERRYMEQVQQHGGVNGLDNGLMMGVGMDVHGDMMNHSDIHPGLIPGGSLTGEVPQSGQEHAHVHGHHHDHHAHAHGHGHEHENEHDFGNWSVQDGQTLLDVVGMGSGAGGHHAHDTMENVFGIGHG
ncbi:hypothetical protein IAU60_003985 [Kwoniella sp. DSM 27419]